MPSEHPAGRESLPTNDAHCVDRERVLALAAEILQAQSALFLLVRSSCAPDLGSLESTTAQVGSWITELGDSLTGKRASPLAQDDRVLRRLHLELARTHEVLQRFVPFRARRGAQVSAAVTMDAITTAHLHLRSARRDSDTFTAVLATCCAADVQKIAQRRNR